MYENMSITPLYFPLFHCRLFKNNFNRLNVCEVTTQVYLYQIIFIIFYQNSVFIQKECSQDITFKKYI